jgi:hypothetical protein
MLLMHNIFCDSCSDFRRLSLHLVLLNYKEPGVLSQSILLDFIDEYEFVRIENPHSIQSISVSEEISSN